MNDLIKIRFAIFEAKLKSNRLIRIHAYHLVRNETIHINKTYQCCALKIKEVCLKKEWVDNL